MTDRARYVSSSLEASWRCSTPGCERHIWEGANCYRHGGIKGPEWESSVDGRLVFFTSGDTEDDLPRTAA